MSGGFTATELTILEVVLLNLSIAPPGRRKGVGGDLPSLKVCPLGMISSPTDNCQTTPAGSSYHT